MSLRAPQAESDFQRKQELPAHPAEVDAAGLCVDVHEVVHQPRLEVA